MSKMSNLNLELQEQANELGFSTVQEALDNGYEVDYFWNSSDAEDFGTHPELVNTKDEWSLKEAHEAWLKEKEEVLEGLNGVAEYFEAMGYPDNYVPTEHGKTIRHAIEFIKKGEV